MKLKVQAVMDATIVLTAIINGKRPMPQRGKYLVARMHSKLLPEFKIIDARRDAMIKEYGQPQTKMVVNEETGLAHDVPVEGEWQVPADKMPEFTATWIVIGNEEIDVDVDPIPMSSLSLPNGSDGAIEASELIALGELVSDA